jgi:hypothetical protein
MSEAVATQPDDDDSVPTGVPDPSPDPVETTADVGAAANGSARTEPVTCPECGTTAEVALARRQASDFCRRCDFPLFWTPQTIQLGDRDTDEATLRRLPGTAGRVTVASVACPHCDEANPLSATLCGRCGLPMVVAPPPAPPEPVIVSPPPAPPPEPEPEPRTSWWPWVAGVATLTLAVLLAWWVVVRG